MRLDPFDWRIGVFWDSKTRVLVIMPLPMLVFAITFGHRCAWCERSNAQLLLADGRHACSEEHYMNLIGHPER